VRFDRNEQEDVIKRSEFQVEENSFGIRGFP
jgi:hypothetical protein